MFKAFLLSLVIILTSCAREAPVQPPAQKPAPHIAGDANRGRELITTYGCNACHIIPGVDGPRAMLGPPLQNVGSRPSINFRVPNTPENMALWLRDPRSVDPDSTMPDLGVTPLDATDMTAYLFTLR
jgi:cytochrome c